MKVRFVPPTSGKPKRFKRDQIKKSHVPVVTHSFAVRTKPKGPQPSVKKSSKKA